MKKSKFKPRKTKQEKFDEEFEKWGDYFSKIEMIAALQCGCGKEIAYKIINTSKSEHGVTVIYDCICKKCKKNFLFARLQKLSAVGYKTATDKKKAFHWLQHMLQELEDENVAYETRNPARKTPGYVQ